jgi:hypothetical protein
MEAEEVIIDIVYASLSSLKQSIPNVESSSILTELLIKIVKAVEAANDSNKPFRTIHKQVVKILKIEQIDIIFDKLNPTQKALLSALYKFIESKKTYFSEKEQCSWDSSFNIQLFKEYSSELLLFKSEALPLSKQELVLREIKECIKNLLKARENLQQINSNEKIKEKINLTVFQSTESKNSLSYNKYNIIIIISGSKLFCFHKHKIEISKLLSSEYLIVDVNKEENKKEFNKIFVSLNLTYNPYFTSILQGLINSSELQQAIEEKGKIELVKNLLLFPSYIENLILYPSIMHKDVFTSLFYAIFHSATFLGIEATFLNLYLLYREHSSEVARKWYEQVKNSGFTDEEENWYTNNKNILEIMLGGFQEKFKASKTTALSVSGLVTLSKEFKQLMEEKYFKEGHTLSLLLANLRVESSELIALLAPFYPAQEKEQHRLNKLKQEKLKELIKAKVAAKTSSSPLPEHTLQDLITSNKNHEESKESTDHEHSLNITKSVSSNTEIAQKRNYTYLSELEHDLEYHYRTPNSANIKEKAPIDKKKKAPLISVLL